MKKLQAILIVFITLCLLLPLAASEKTAEKKEPAKATPAAKQNSPVAAPPAAKQSAPATSPPAAKQNTPAAAAQPPKAADTGFDVILLMDSSGSMKKTDPSNYRKAAAKLLISLLKENDRLGVMSFGDTVRSLIPLTPDTKQNRSKLFAAVDKISSREFSTHIHSAVEKGYEELKASDRKNRIIVLMSDGKLTLGGPEKDKAAVLELRNFLPTLSQAGIPIYSVAFSDLSDDKLLESLARETGGFFRFAKQDKDIHVIFTSIFEKMKSPESVPLEGEEFSLDKDVKEATLVITKKAGTSTFLVSPSKETFKASRHAKNINWFETGVFDMITISEPASGRWRVKLSTQTGNRVFIITNLSLKSSFNKSFAQKGEDIVVDAWLEKDGGMIKEKDVLDKVVFSSDVAAPGRKAARLALQDNGTYGDAKAGDAVYSSHFGVDSLGQYELKILAEGKTFKREKVFHFNSVEPSQQPKESSVEPKKQATEPKREIPKDEVSWKQVLMKFGIVNLALLAVVILVVLVRKVIIKIRAKGPKAKKKK